MKAAKMELGQGKQISFLVATAGGHILEMEQTAHLFLQLTQFE